MNEKNELNRSYEILNGDDDVLLLEKLLLRCVDLKS